MKALPPRADAAPQEPQAPDPLVARYLFEQHPEAFQTILDTIAARVPGVTAVRDVTDHDTGDAPYIPRESAA